MPSAYVNGAALATGNASYVTGFASAAVVVIGMVLGPIVLDCFRTRDRLRGALLAPAWIIAFGFTLAGSVGFAAGNRGDAVQSKSDRKSVV